MPEGPEIRRAADKIERAIANRPLEKVWFAFESLKPFENRLQTSQVKGIRTWGKAMLTVFDCDLQIYSHNQLYGVWNVVKAGRYPSTQRQLRLEIQTDQKAALLYSASDIEVLAQEDVLWHPFLSKLGPDILGPDITPTEICDRLGSERFYRRQLGSLLLDQHCLSGLGNYLRSEILFVSRLRPQVRPRDLTPSQLETLSGNIIDITWQAYKHNGITNDLSAAQTLKTQGYRRAHYRHWVFAREHRSCWRCDAVIAKQMIAGRRLYFCPRCQPA